MTPSIVNIICFVVGLGLGIVFFTMLKMNSEIYIIDGMSWTGLMLHTSRFAATILIFWIISGFGALPLLCSFGGFLLGRFTFMKFLTKWKE